MSDDDVRALLAAYALDAVDDAERALVERETGPQCLVLPPEVSQFIRAPRHAAPPFVLSLRSAVARVTGGHDKSR